MRRAVPALLAAALLAAGLLAACSSPAADDPSAVSRDEARQLNEAAEMLDANSVDLNALPAPTNESQPQ